MPKVEFQIGDASTILSDHINGFQSSLIDVDKVKGSSNYIVAIASISQVSIYETNWENPSQSHIILNYQQQNITSTPTIIKWLPIQILFVGFEDGTIFIFNKHYDILFTNKLCKSAVQSMKYQKLYDAYMLYILYESGYIVMIPFQDNGEIYYSDSIKLKLLDHNPVNDFIISPYVYSSVDKINLNGFEESEAISFYVGGYKSSLSIYNFGEPKRFQHLGKLAEYVKDKITTAIGRTFTSFVNVISLSSVKSENIMKNHDDILPSVLDFKDSKRRVQRMSLDSLGNLIALADSLGRVLLYDLKMNSIVRIWKGLREARVCWKTKLIPIKASKKLYSEELVIYAPLIGIIYVYNVRAGPCTRCIPIGLNCQLFSLPSCDDPRLVDCYIMSLNSSLDAIEFYLIDDIDQKPNEKCVDEVDISSLENLLQQWNLDDTKSDYILNVLRCLEENIDNTGIDKSNPNSWNEIDSFILKWIQDHQSQINLQLCKNIMKLLEIIELKHKYAIFSIDIHQELIHQYQILTDDTDEDIYKYDNVFEVYKAIITICKSYEMSSVIDLNDEISQVCNCDSNYAETMLWVLKRFNVNRKMINNDMSEWSQSLGLTSINQSVLSFTIFREILLHIIPVYSLIRQDKRMHNLEFDNCQQNVIGIMFLKALITDIFSYQQLSHAIFRLDWTYADYISSLIPWFVMSFQNLKVKDVVVFLIRCANNSCPLQRLLRDSILGLYDSFAMYKKSISTEDASDDESIDEDPLTPDNLYLMKAKVIRSHLNDRLKDLQYSYDMKTVSDDEVNRDIGIFDAIAKVLGIKVTNLMFQQVLRYLLEPIFLTLQQLTNLEVVLAITSCLLDSLSVMQIQLEKKSYGQVDLSDIINELGDIFHQTRVVLVMQGLDLIPTDCKDISITSFSSNNLGLIFHCLAMESLNFTMNANEATNHEGKCRSLSSKMTSTTSIDIVVVDIKSWKMIVESILMIESSKSDMPIKRKPLLLMFPLHNNTNYLAIHRTLILLDKWKEKQTIKYLSLAIDHLYSIPDDSLRYIVTCILVESYILSAIKSSWTEDSDIFQDFKDLLVSNKVACSEFISLLTEVITSNVLNVNFNQFKISSVDANQTIAVSSKIWPSLQNKRLEDIISKFHDDVSRVSCQLVLSMVLTMKIHIDISTNLRDCSLLQLCPSIVSATDSTYNSNKTSSLRLDFIRSYLYSICPGNISSALRKLCELWIIPMNQVYLSYISIVINRVTYDSHLERLIGQVDIRSQESFIEFLDCILESMRLRLGKSISLIEKMPQHSQIILSMNPDVLQWLNRKSNCLDSINHLSINTNRKPSISLEQPIYFNIASTKYIMFHIQKLIGNYNHEKLLSYKLLVQSILDILSLLSSISNVTMEV